MRQPKPDSERSPNAMRVAKFRAKQKARIAELEAEVGRLTKLVKDWQSHTKKTTLERDNAMAELDELKTGWRGVLNR